MPPQRGHGRYDIAQHPIAFEYEDGRRDEVGSTTLPLIVINTCYVVRVHR